jgi:lactate permease
VRLLAQGLPIDPFHWALALVPIVVLLVLLVGRHWKAPEAGPIGLLVAVVIGIVFFQASAEDIAVSAGKGVWDAIFILLVVWPALLLYRVTDRAGAQEALRRGLSAFSRNDLFLILGFGWVFASFLQGITGFGTPIAVVAPLLVALGVKPLLAVVVPLIGHAWANLFGTLGVAWLGTLQVIDLQDTTGTAWRTALLLAVPNVTAGIAIAWLVGKRAAVVSALPMIGVIGVIHSGGQLALVAWDPLLAAFIPATVALLALYPLSRWERYSEPDENVDVSEAKGEQGRTEEEDEPEPVMGLGMALLPYAVLTVVAIALLAISPVRDLLEGVEFGPTFPAVTTGYGFEVEAEDPYSPLEPLTHPGLFLLAGSAVAWGVYRAKGYQAEWRERSGSEGSLVGDVFGDAVPASVAVVSFLLLSTVMEHSGQTETLAQGVADVAPGGVFAVLGAWIGLLGSFMTTSNTSSNILFSPLQQSVAEAQGLSESAIISGQHAGGAIGNSIAPANIVLGTGPAGISGEEGNVLRRVLPWTLGVTFVVGLATLGLEVLG